MHIRTRSIASLALLALAGLVLPLAAQAAEAEQNAPRLTVEEDEDQGTRIRLERELKLPPVQGLPASKECRAEIAISYVQKNTLADVDGTIENPTCGASSGEFTLAVSVRDDSGALQTLEFQQSWQRTDDKTVEFSAEYPIPENVDLLRIRSRRGRCECVEAPAAAD